MAGGRPLWTHGRAVWHFPEGDLAYVELATEPGAVVYDVAPGE